MAYNPKTLRDANLDEVFAIYFDAGMFQDAQAFGAEIRARLASPLSFVQGVFGGRRFPKYEARTQGQFSQSGAAQDSLANAAKDVGGVLASGSSYLLIGAGVVLAVVLWSKLK